MSGAITVFTDLVPPPRLWIVLFGHDLPTRRNNVEHRESRVDSSKLIARACLFQCAEAPDLHL